MSNVFPVPGKCCMHQWKINTLLVLSEIFQTSYKSFDDWNSKFLATGDYKKY